MRLIACRDCHAQYDVSHVAVKHFPCRCGSEIENRALTAVDAKVHRCGSCGAIVRGEVDDCSYCGSEIVRDAGRLSLICPECFARNADESRFCTACGIAFRPEPVPVTCEELPCPACGAQMPSQNVGGVAVNECTACHGLWAPVDGFDVLVKRASEARQEAREVELAVRPRADGANPLSQKVAYRKCPHCETLMQRRNYGRSSGVIVDVCHEHGTWLDADELEQIAGYILSGRSEARTFVHREHEKHSVVGSARLDAAFHRVLAENGEGMFAPPQKGLDEGWTGTILKFLTALLR